MMMKALSPVPQRWWKASRRGRVTQDGSRSALSPVAQLERGVRDLVVLGKAPIPPYPAVALRVKQAATGKDFGLAEISRLVSGDAALAADVLRCANSALYRRGSPVTKLSQAVTRLGAQEVARLALTSSLGVHAQAPGPLAPLRRMIWIDTLASAVLSQELAVLRHLRVEEAFVLGLLHDFGKVIASASLETVLDEGLLVAEGPVHISWPLETWMNLVNSLHVSLGVEMALQWSLPPLVAEVISAHHGMPTPCSDPALLEVVKAADDVVALLTRSPHVAGTDLAGIARLDSALERDTMVGVIEKIPEFVASFEAPVARERDRSSLISHSWPPVKPGPEQVKYEVSISFAHRAREYTAASITPSALVVYGREPVPENRLLEAEIRCQPRPIRFWALARQSRSEGREYRIELQPYALSGEARGMWTKLVMDTEVRN
jgi:putative nucleotidyltransferase with HDIG domain